MRPPWLDLERRSETQCDAVGSHAEPTPPLKQKPPAARLTSFCCRSSSFILMSRASARAARFAASLASACNRPEIS